MRYSVLLREDLLAVFEYVARCRLTRFKDVCEDLDLPSATARNLLDELAQAGLIKCRDAPSNILDFRHYYISAEGLQAERELGLNRKRGGVMPTERILLIVFLAILCLIALIVLVNNVNI